MGENKRRKGETTAGERRKGKGRFYPAPFYLLSFKRKRQTRGGKENQQQEETQREKEKVQQEETKTTDDAKQYQEEMGKRKVNPPLVYSP